LSIAGCTSNEACNLHEICDDVLHLCVATWLDGVSDMIANGEDALDVALAIQANLTETTSVGWMQNYLVTF